MKLEECEKIVDTFIAKYNGYIPLEIIIVEKQEDIYGPHSSEQYCGYEIEGAYHPSRGTVVLTASSLCNQGEVCKVLRHEILGHFGLNTFRPEEKSELLLAITKTQIEPSLKHIWDYVSFEYPTRTLMQLAEEVFAFVAEDERTFAEQCWDKVRSVFQKALRKTGLSDGELTIYELRCEAQAISKGIMEGRLVQQVFPRTDQDQFRISSNQSEIKGCQAQDFEEEQSISFSP